MGSLGSVVGSRFARERALGGAFDRVDGDDSPDLDAALAAAVAGDEGGFAVLWRALQPALLRYLWVVVGAAAEDVASETWLQAARDIPGFTGGATAFRVWLFRIGRHRAMDEQRRAGRRREDAREPSDQALGGPPVPDVAADVLEKSGTDWALGLIATLPPDQAEAVMLRVVAGLGVAQVAEVLGKRPGAVRVASMRGLRRLALHPDLRDRASNGQARPPRQATAPGGSVTSEQVSAAHQVTSPDPATPADPAAPEEV
jgi:RNA polymerase sigma-70 factor (ECF subfamily)